MTADKEAIAQGVLFLAEASSGIFRSELLINPNGTVKSVISSKTMSGSIMKSGRVVQPAESL